MFKYMVQFTCECDDNVLIELFNFLNDFIRKGQSIQIEPAKLHPFSIQLKRIPNGVLPNEKLAPYFDTMKPVHLACLDHNMLDQIVILVTLHIEDDSKLDIFSYRYLFLIMNQLLRKDDMVSFDCAHQYYHKLGSYFVFQTLSSRCRIFYHDDKGPFPKKFSLSTEWLPAIYFSKENPELFNVLSNPIYANKEDLDKALKIFMTNSDKAKLKVDLTGIPQKFNPRQVYRDYFQKCIVKWINNTFEDNEENVFFLTQLSNVPGIAQLMFALIYHRLTKRSKHKLEYCNLIKLLEVCCDFSDCILQVSENIISHTCGGVLSMRFNDNWSKIEDTFIASPDLSAKDWYMRISLVDYSNGSVLDTIKDRVKIEKLTLSHVFLQEEVPSSFMGSPREYHEILEEYQNHLNESSQIIHHYGLPVFQNVVNQYNGCFTVRCGIKGAPNDIKQYYRDSKMISFVPSEASSHIPGTEYDILLPLTEAILSNETSQYKPSLMVTPQYIAGTPDRSEVFEREIYNFFNKPLSTLILQNDRKQGYQRLKEDVVKIASMQLAQKMLDECNRKINEKVFYFHISNVVEQVFGRTEIIAKIILQTVAILKKENCGNPYFVLYGFSCGRLMLFTRQFALFYHRSEGNRLMNGCQLYAISADYDSEVLFAGSGLSAIADYSKGRRLVTGASDSVSRLLEHVSSREAHESYFAQSRSIQPFPFDLLNRMEEQKNDSWNFDVVCNENKKWYYHNLTKILKTDIHSKNLGSLLDNVHVRAGAVHSSTFYEGQLLFGNAYWYQIFAHFLFEKICQDTQINTRTKLLLYGYETYSEQMLFTAVEKLKAKGYDARYVLFENPKYITSNETSKQRVRYIEDFWDSRDKKQKQNTCIIYVLGIGTTLATLEKCMHTELYNAFMQLGKPEVLRDAYKKGIVVIQVAHPDNIPGLVVCNRANHTVQSSRFDLSFLTNGGICDFLVDASAEWFETKKCPFCFPERVGKSYLAERPLIQTNETSTVPMLLIKPEKRVESCVEFIQEKTFTESFLKNPRNADYLYYCHVNRVGNHYQYYMRTAALASNYLRDQNPDILNWFKLIREKEVDTQISSTKMQINVIVSPLHFSNESLPTAINKYVFNGSAYVISFDVRKEFRDSFVAKFQNYCSALEMLMQSLDNINQGATSPVFELNFYFVDDIIVTGTTFNRTKSLVSSMLEEFIHNHRDSKQIAVNLFKAIILLVNRNSKDTLRGFFDYNSLKCVEDKKSKRLQLPVYRFIELNTPTIRSYGDSCPICNKVERIKVLEKESALTFVAHHWQRKIEYHKLKKLSDAKLDKECRNGEHVYDDYYTTRGLRRLQCSEYIWQILKQDQLNTKTSTRQLECAIDEYLSTIENDAEKTEYLISFLKIISREHVVYQEVIQTAAMRILLSIFSLFLQDNNVEKTGLYKTIEDLIHNSDFASKCPIYPYTLYKVVIARLCAMGSNVFCHGQRLMKCLEVGLEAEQRCADITDMVNDDEECFYAFLCIQLKKMLFITSDCHPRIEILEKILRDNLEKEFQKMEGEKNAIEST